MGSRAGRIGGGAVVRSLWRTGLRGAGVRAADPPVRVVLVGLGFAGSRLLLPALCRLPGVAVVAAADPDPAARAAALRQFAPLDTPSSGGGWRKRRGFTTAGVANPLRSPGGVPMVVASWEEAVATAADAVVVATPVETHAAVATAALGAGCHVYVEKPMAAGTAEAVALAVAAERAGRVMQVGHAYRFHPLWRRARALVTAGTLAPPLVARARFDAADPLGAGWRHPFVEVGIHHVDLLAWCLGAPPARVHARAAEQVVVEWADGSRLEGRYGPGPGADRVELRGADGAVVTVDRLRGLRLTGSGARRTSTRLPSLPLVRARVVSRAWERSFEWALGAFVDGVRADSRHPDAAGPREGVWGAAFAEAALRARPGGGPVDVVVPTWVAPVVERR